MSKLSDVMTLLRKYNGEIPLDTDGSHVYMVKTITEDNFDDIPETLTKQLKAEGKSNYYISCIAYKGRERTINNLPLYGNANKFVTKWLTPNMEDCVNHDVRDKWMGLYNRIMAFEENKELV